MGLELMIGELQGARWIHDAQPFHLCYTKTFALRRDSSPALTYCNGSVPVLPLGPRQSWVRISPGGKGLAWCSEDGMNTGLREYGQADPLQGWQPCSCKRREFDPNILAFVKGPRWIHYCTVSAELRGSGFILTLRLNPLEQSEDLWIPGTWWTP